MKIAAKQHPETNTVKRSLFADYPDIVTHSDLCRMMHISKNTAYDLLRSGNLPHFKMGHKYLIPKESVVEYIGKRMG